MKELFFTISIVLIVVQLQAQLINCNPNPNGTPWWAGGDIPMSAAERLQTPVMVPNSASLATSLPSVVDNAQLQYMRPIFTQIQGSCAQAAGIGYIFTYEINRIRNTSANTTSRRYHHLYTFNFVRHTGLGGNDYGSSFEDGWDLVKENGCPNDAVYDNPYGPYDPEAVWFWMSGYDKYYSGFNNRVKQNYVLLYNHTGSNLSNVKHWIKDHCRGASTGGLVGISIKITGVDVEQFVSGTPEAGESFVYNWGPSGNHAMTIVGYNDEVKYDFNNDGQYTNNLDINGPSNNYVPDGVVNMYDWEIGAFKLANSWGMGWYDEGYIYMPYKHLVVYNGTTPTTRDLRVIEVFSSYQTKVALKGKIEHSDRKKLQIPIGISSNPNATTPSSYEYSAYFLNSAGEDGKPMNGINNTPLEFAYDLGYWYSDSELDNLAKAFLVVKESSSPHIGTMKNTSIIDYRYGTTIEAEYPLINQAFNLTYNYYGFHHLLPLSITSNVSYSTDIVSRKTLTLSNNARVSIGNGVQLDMYSSTITVSAGSKLTLLDNAIIKAKSGVNNIQVYGDLIIGDNVQFISESGASLNVYIRKTNQSLTVDDLTISGAKIYSYPNGATYNDCSITNGELNFIDCNFTVDDCSFSDSRLAAVGPGSSFKTATISNCSFTNYSGNPLLIQRYGAFSITNNTISNSESDGIYLYYSGFSSTTNLVQNNTLSNNGGPDSDGTGIKLYATTAKLKGNQVSGSKYGVSSLNNCNTRLEGVSGGSCNQTNNIHDNSIHQVYATSGAFPVYFYYNCIVDENNTSPLVKYTGSCNSGSLNVQKNHWGSNFSASSDLYPSACYGYTPFWTPSLKEDILDTEEGMMYVEAMNALEDDKPNKAKNKFKKIIKDFPNTNYAIASVSMLFNLEKSHEKAFKILQKYFKDEVQSESYSALMKTASFFMNRCDIELEDYQKAIDWYEAIIDNPATDEDYIFAIIDLADLFEIINFKGLKSSVNTKYSQFQFVNAKEYSEHREYYLEQLFKEGNQNVTLDTEQTKMEASIIEDVKCFPNPFTDETKIAFTLSESVKVKIIVYNALGHEQKVLTNENLSKGSHQFVLNGDDLSEGLYFYSIVVNGCQLKPRKIILLK